MKKRILSLLVLLIAVATGVAAGTQVKTTYGGTKKVKSVKAVKKAPVSLIVNPAVGQIIGDDGKNYNAGSLPSGVKAVAMIAYVGAGIADVSSTYRYKGLAIALNDAEGSTITWGKNGEYAGLTCYGNWNNGTANDALNDLAGIANTNVLASKYATEPLYAAAKIAKEYKYDASVAAGATPSGTSQWFLPTIAQWNMMVKSITGSNADFVMSGNGSVDVYTATSINSHCAANLSGGYYWTSTEAGDSYVWFYGTGDGCINVSPKENGGGLLVRPVLAFAPTVSSITLNKTTMSIQVGATETLSVTAVLPEDAEDKTYTWKTSDANVATVSNDGVVTAMTEGTVTIYAEANDDSSVKSECYVSVADPNHEFDVTIGSGTTDAANWSITVGGTVTSKAKTGQQVTLQYGGESKVKNVTGSWVMGSEKLIYDMDFSTATEYTFNSLGASATVSDGQLVLNNPQVQTNNWDVQPEIGRLSSAAPTTQGNIYRVVMEYKTTVAGDVTFALGAQDWSNADWKGQSITVSDDFQTCEGYFDNFPYSNAESHILLQFGALEGTITIKDVKVYETKPFPLDIAWDANTKTATIAEMPAGNVTVDMDYYEKAGVTLAVDGIGGTASLMEKTFNTLTSGDKILEGEKFALSIVKDDGYDFDVTVSTGGNSILAEFSAEDYQNYINYAKANNIMPSPNTVLAWVTMPDTDGGDLTVTVTFQKPKTYTVLYQPTTSSNEVWCRIGKSGVTETFNVVKMKSDSEMGGSTVWSVKVTTASDPTKIGFFTSKEAAENGNATNDAVVTENASSWTPIDGGKYLIIGGNAKTVVAAFVADASSMPVYDSENVSMDGSTNTSDVKYQIAVCPTDNEGNITSSGSITIPAAPSAPAGKTFVVWSTLEGTAPNKIEHTYNPDAQVNISENMIFTAVWKPTTLTATVDLNGGTGIAGNSNVTYGETLSLSDPTRYGFAFDGWTVSNPVTENGQIFGKGAPFYLNTPITADLGLTAQWKHVHRYTCYQISLFPTTLADCQQYNNSRHIAVCSCNRVVMTAHTFNSKGKCACGYSQPILSTDVTLDVSYGIWSDNSYTEKMSSLQKQVKKNDEVFIDAPSSMYGNDFVKWQYSTDNGATWDDLSANLYQGFLIPCSMQVRALYINPVTAPQVELSVRLCDAKTEQGGQTYIMDNLGFLMNYKLPDGYTLEDAGLRLGDNEGISYYELKERTYTMDDEAKAIGASVCVATFVLGGGINTFDTSASENYYALRENSVLDEMSAAELAKYMYEKKPVNVEKYPPIYWGCSVPTKASKGSLGGTPPLRRAQMNNGNHWIYGIAWLKYKKPGGTIETIYTDALAATINNVPTQPVTKKAGSTNARMMAPENTTGSSARRTLKAPGNEQQGSSNGTIDMSLVFTPETELNVYVDGEWSADLSDSYGYGDKATVTAPAVSGKSFSYWTTDDGAVISTNQTLTLTINANTTLHAVYGGVSKTAKPAITSVTRTNDGEKIVLQAIVTGTVDAAGIVYSATATEPTIGAGGVTQVEAVKYDNLPTNGSPMPASVLDKNNCWTLQITPANETTVYYARAYATIGGSTTYGDVKAVTLGDLKGGMMMIANIEAFIPGIDDELIALKNSGAITAGYQIDIPAGEFATFYSDKAVIVEDGSDTKLYTVVSVSGNNVILSDPYDAMPENTPMLVYNPTADDVTAQLILYDDPGLPPTVYDGFKGTAEDKALNADGNGPWNFADNTKYYGFDGTNFVLIKDAGAVAAHRCWIEMSSASPARQLTIVWGEGTGVKEVNEVKEVNDNSLYDLQGRKVQGKPARKGVYIQNGKKKVIK